MELCQTERKRMAFKEEVVVLGQGQDLNQSQWCDTGMLGKLSADCHSWVEMCVVARVCVGEDGSRGR